MSSLSEAIQFQRPNGTLVISKSTVTIGPGVTIESARSGSGNDVLIGNNVANNLNGMAGNDSLRGGYGNDALTGGLGNDYFFFNTAPNSSTNHDLVLDYDTPRDTIRSKRDFLRLAVSTHLDPAYFRAAAHALDSNDFIIYNRSTGGLIYDPNANVAAKY